MASQVSASSTSPPAALSPAIETDHLRREYGEVVAVSDLALTVERGVIFGLLGPNGGLGLDYLVGRGLLTVLVLVAARLYPGLAR